MLGATYAEYKRLNPILFLRLGFQAGKNKIGTLTFAWSGSGDVAIKSLQDKYVKMRLRVFDLVADARGTKLPKRLRISVGGNTIYQLFCAHVLLPVIFYGLSYIRSSIFYPHSSTIYVGNRNSLERYNSANSIYYMATGFSKMWACVCLAV